MTPGDYLNVKPTLASAWARTPDGKGWRFTMRPGTKFNSGNPVTVDDVKWSFERVINVKDQPSQYVATGRSCRGRRSQDHRRDHEGSLRSRCSPCCAVPNFGVMERKVVEAHGGTSGAERQHRGQGHPVAEPELGRRRSVHAGRLDPQRADPADAQSALLARAGAFRARGAAPHGRQRDAVAGDQARRHRCGVQPDPRTGGDAEGRYERARRGAGEPRLRLHGADLRAGLQQGAGGEGGAPGDLERDRLRRHHQQHAGRPGDPLRQLHPDRAVWLDARDDEAVRLSPGSRPAEAVAAEGRLPGRVRVQAELRRCRGVGAVLCGAGAEAAVRSGARRHQGEPRSDGSGEPAHAVHHRQVHRGADVLESVRRRDGRLGIGDGAARRQARSLDAAGRPGEAGVAGGGGARCGEAVRAVSGIREGDDRPGEPDRPVPADLPVRGARCDQDSFR